MSRIAPNRVPFLSNVLFLVFACFSFGMVVGCGAGTCSVEGTVSYEGKSIKVGQVNITGADGVIQSGDIQRDGTYKVTGLKAGDLKVSVVSVNPKAFAGREKARDVKDVKGENAAAQGGEVWVQIPIAYGNPETSGLKVSATGGANKYDIKLTKK